MKKVFLGLCMLSLSFTISCSNDDGGSNDEVTNADVIENYADVVYANYSEAYWDAAELEATVNDFVANPTQEAFNNVKLKWKEARETFGTTEPFRFNGSPIESEYSKVNAWPLDENYIDYISTDATTGIINNTTAYPVLSKELLASLNQMGGQKNISVGYHAIEFLLWGQDLTAPADNLAGQRPYTDFVDGGTAANQDRRRQYLSLCADLLTDSLSSVMNAWAEGGSYRTTFLALDENTALQTIYSGVIGVIETRMPAELLAAVQGQTQENEQSAFSDYTQRDFMNAFKGVLNIYRGQYSTVSGPGLQILVYMENADTYSDTEEAFDLVEEGLDLIVIPFDLAIEGGPTSAEGEKVVTAAENLEALATQLRLGAEEIGISL